jgi:hypothetical protein
MGRTTTFTQETADEICKRLEKGEPLAWICRDEHMPAVRTVSDWKKSDELFAANFARAREAGFDAIAADCLEIADDGTNDYMTITKGDASYNVEDKEVTSRSKLRVETRLKLLAKWYPKKYGDKLELDGKVETTPPITPEMVAAIANKINKNSKA